MWLSEHEAGALQDAADDEADRLNAAREEADEALTKRATNAIATGGTDAQEVMDELWSYARDLSEFDRRLIALLASSLNSHDAAVKDRAHELQALLVANYVESLIDSEAMERMA